MGEVEPYSDLGEHQNFNEKQVNHPLNGNKT